MSSASRIDRELACVRFGRCAHPPGAGLQGARHTRGGDHSAWGMSENGAVTTTRPEDPKEKTMAMDGCARPGMEERVVDANRKVVAPGSEGQLQVRGCYNFIGYLRRPGLDNADTDGRFDTGPRMDANRFIRIVGLDGMVSATAASGTTKAQDCRLSRPENRRTCLRRDGRLFEGATDRWGGRRVWR
jgi:acyl-CoA synthetase (AMP-forming)/AMP-acid ligase II